MARGFKELTGNITKLNDPHFVAARGLWVMMRFMNTRWICTQSTITAAMSSFTSTVMVAKSANPVIRIESSRIAFGLQAMGLIQKGFCFMFTAV